MTDNNGALKGLLVIELASVLAGPSVGTFLAELGARVIKIENPATGGDVTRTWKLPVENTGNSLSAYYSSVNWGKEVWNCNLKKSLDHNRVLNVIRKADVVISSYRKEVDVHLGMDPKSLHAINPNLIVGRITGFGPNNPRPAFDVVLQAETGWMSMNGTAESGPVKIPVALMDVLAAHQLKEGILLALLQRAQGDSGKLVEVSLYDAAISGLVNQASNYLMAGHIPRRMGSLHPNIAPYGETFRCKDDNQIVLAVGTDVQFQNLCVSLGESKLAENTHFAANRDRVINRVELKNALNTLFAKYCADELMLVFEKNFVPAGRVMNLKEVFERPEAQHLVLEEKMGNGEMSKRVAGRVFKIYPPIDEC